MVEVRKVGVVARYEWHDGPSMHFRFTELLDESVRWVIAFLNARHGMPTISNPQFMFPVSEDGLTG